VRQATERIEFGDFQTPYALALAVCQHLASNGTWPDLIIEPSCGLGTFVAAAAKTFPFARNIIAAEINREYVTHLNNALHALPRSERIDLQLRDYFQTDWAAELQRHSGHVLVLGNFPWVTNSTQGEIGGTNLPSKSNFLKLPGIDAITGKANFDISEWMLLDVIGWLATRDSTLAMLCKSAVARKVIAHAERKHAPLADASLTRIDAMRHFGASVDACLLIMRFSSSAPHAYDYTVYGDLGETSGTTMGSRLGLPVSDIPTFDANVHLIGNSPVRWRSGVKHDAVQVMEIQDRDGVMVNMQGEPADIEDTYLYPMVKGTDLNHGRVSNISRYMIVPQRSVGAPTAEIEYCAPKTWAYLSAHRTSLGDRKSSIYRTNPRFSVFGVGDYTFKPWKIAVSALHKQLSFQMVGPCKGKPVVFDDTVYFMGFDSYQEANIAYESLTSWPVLALLGSLMFRDEKRAIKAQVLNRVDWSRANLGGTLLRKADP
jgi:hypothetical protein